jgi:hypothetical protein
MYYFAPYDAQWGNLRNTAVNSAILADAVSSIPARNLIIVIDSCQSGGALDSLIKAGETRQSISDQFGLQQSTYLLAATTSFRKIGLSTSPDGLSPIVRYLLQALESHGKPEKTLRQVLQQVYSEARAEAAKTSAEASQAPKPLVWGAGPDFVFVKGGQR